MNTAGKKPLLALDAPAAHCADRLKKALTSAGLLVVQSFDLQSIRAVHEGCNCPYHGTSRCSCELVILLVYSDLGEPVTIALDGRDGQTQVSVIVDTGNNYHTQETESILLAIQQSVSVPWYRDKVMYNER